MDQFNFNNFPEANFNEVNLSWMLETMSAFKADIDTIEAALPQKVDKSAYNPDTATAAMTQPVGVDANGKLWTTPGGGDTSDLAPVIINTASGAIASFEDGADNRQIRKIVSAIEPAQNGSGDPSPENVRPFTARASVSLTRTGESLIGGEALAESIMAGMPAATIDRTAQTVTFTGRTNGTSNKTLALIPLADGQRCAAILNGRGNISNIRWQYTDGSTDAASALPNWGGAYVSAAGKTVRRLLKINNSGADTVINYADSCILFGVKTAADFQPYQGEVIDIDWTGTAGAIYAGTLTLNADGSAELAVLPHYASYNGEALVGPWVSSMDVYAERATPSVGAEVVDLGGEPTVYPLTDLPQLKTLYGVNNIWCDAGDVSAEYPADTTLYIDARAKATRKLIAGIETGMTASRAYSVGELLIAGDALYRVIATIANGATLTPGTNVTATTVAEQLLLLANN